MAGTKEIKRRIKSIKNTKKITKAMELVAASKMKRAVASTLASREYAEYSWAVLTSIAKNIEDFSHPLFVEKEVRNGEKNILLVTITSNRGLCGAYNAQVIRKALNLFRQKAGKTNVDLITIGRRGDSTMRRVGMNILATFTDPLDNLTLPKVLPISKMVMEEFATGKYDKVLVLYTDFRSALSQKPNIKQILPVAHATLKEFLEGILEDLPAENFETDKKINYLVEGEINTLLVSLAERLVRMQLYQMLLESNASEQSSRMVAMKNATEASGEMIEDLTLVFNKARQSGITREISEISAGMASVS